MVKRISTMVLILVLLVPLAAYSGVPMDTAKKGVDQVLAVAGDPALKGEETKAAKEVKIRGIIGEFFDFAVLSRLTLGKNWKKFNKSQQNDFVSLYRTLLENVYMERILTYSDEKIVFTKEQMLSKKKAEVQSKIVAKNMEIPIHYRMVLRNNQWKVYDVVIEGVSMVKNYRSQFGEILSKDSPDELLESLRKKLKTT